MKLTNITCVKTKVNGKQNNTVTISAVKKLNSSGLILTSSWLWTSQITSFKRQKAKASRGVWGNHPSLKNFWNWESWKWYLKGFSKAVFHRTNVLISACLRHRCYVLLSDYLQDWDLFRWKVCLTNVCDGDIFFVSNYGKKR